MATTKIICPDCKKPVEKVRVYSECYQYGVVQNGEIVDYGTVKEITETIAIECENCTYDFYNKDNAGLNW